MPVNPTTRSVHNEAVKEGNLRTRTQELQEHNRECKDGAPNTEEAPILFQKKRSRQLQRR